MVKRIIKTTAITATILASALAGFAPISAHAGTIDYVFDIAYTGEYSYDVQELSGPKTYNYDIFGTGLFSFKSEEKPLDGLTFDFSTDTFSDMYYSVSFDFIGAKDEPNEDEVFANLIKLELTQDEILNSDSGFNFGISTNKNTTSGQIDALFTPIDYVDFAPIGINKGDTYLGWKSPDFAKDNEIDVYHEPADAATEYSHFGLMDYDSSQYLAGSSMKYSMTLSQLPSVEPTPGAGTMPVSEPSTWMVLLAGLGLLIRRRNKKA